MRYLPLTDDDRRAMLAKIGAPSVDALYNDVPQKVRLTKPVDLPPFKSELEVERHMMKLAGKNLGAGSCPSFLGAGA
jgi:glycine dehydrogenase subunit 1